MRRKGFGRLTRSLEVLHGSFMLLCRCARLERAEVFPFSGFVLLPGVEPVLARFEFSDHLALRLVEVIGMQASLRRRAAPFLLSVFVRAKIAPPSYDLRLSVELELYFGVDDRSGPGAAQDRSATFG